MMTLHLVEGASKAEQMLHTHIVNTSLLLEGVVLAEAEGDTRCQGLNLAGLPRETLY